MNAAVFLLLALPSAAASLPPIRGVLLISLDSVRADYVGAYGAARPATPHLDRVAAEGVVFESAWSQAPLSLPSHASVMTGLFPRSHGAWAPPERLASGATTLAESFKSAGWRTAAFTGGFSIQGAFGLSRGFEVYQDGDPRASLSVTAPMAARWLETLRSEERFFLFLHGYDAHPPYRVSAAELKRFDPDYSGPISAARIDHTFADRICGGVLHEEAGCIGAGVRLRPKDTEHLKAVYAGAIAAADQRIGALFAELKKRGRWEDTLVVVLSDHGELIEDHEHALLSPVGELFDDSLRVPLIMKIPGRAPRRVAAAVRLIDVAPTIYELSAVPAPGGMQGASLTPEIRDETSPTARPIVSQAERASDRNPCAGLRSEKWLLVRCRGRSDSLFTPRADSRLLYDRAESDSRRRVELGKMMDAWESTTSFGRPDPASDGSREAERSVRRAASRLARSLNWPVLARRREKLERPFGLGYSGDWGVAISKIYHGIIPEDFRAFFDRDPERFPPAEPRIVVAPADGIVLDALEGSTTNFLVISLGMGDVHVQRVPLDGRVVSVVERGMGHLSTSDPGHFKNVQRVTTIDSPIGRYVLTQITGIWTKRISVFFRAGDPVRLGQRFGRILLGSTVTLELPARAKLTVRRYDRVWAGESVVARY